MKSFRLSPVNPFVRSLALVISEYLWPREQSRSDESTERRETVERAIGENSKEDILGRGAAGFQGREDVSVLGAVGANGTADGPVSPKAIGRDQSASVRPSAP
ncbi:hypothetical protein KM043_004029 [Ampulex compressa]|nr:hypothetical protein KM043_004029 [Ampulex compressa]